MFGLMLKDFLLIRRERTFILMVAVSFLSYAALSSSPALALLMAALPAYAVVGWCGAYDFKYRADTFLNLLPASRSEVVGSRYLLALAIWMISMLMASAGWLVARIAGIGPPAAPLGFSAVVLGVVMILCGVYLCSYYLFGYQSARWANTIVFASIGLVGGAVGAFRGGPGASGLAGTVTADLVFGEAPPPIYAAVLGAGCVVFFLSFQAARTRYRRAEF